MIGRQIASQGKAYLNMTGNMILLVLSTYRLREDRASL